MTQSDPRDIEPKPDGNRRDWWNVNPANAGSQPLIRPTLPPPTSSFSNAPPTLQGSPTFEPRTALEALAPRRDANANVDAFIFTPPKAGPSLSEKRIRLIVLLGQIAIGVVVLVVIAFLTQRRDSPLPVADVPLASSTSASVHIVLATITKPNPTKAIPNTPTPEATATPVATSAALPLPSVSMSTDVSATMTVLPCRKFTFLPDSAELTQESRDLLNQCVLPALQERGGLYLLVRGSAAWPGPQGTYTEAQIREAAKSRAQAIVDYLVSQKIDPARFRVEGVVPPEEHRETSDPIKQAEDRWVEMTLIVGGR